MLGRNDFAEEKHQVLAFFPPVIPLIINSKVAYEQKKKSLFWGITGDYIFSTYQLTRSKKNVFAIA